MIPENHIDIAEQSHVANRNKDQEIRNSELKSLVATLVEAKAI